MLTHSHAILLLLTAKDAMIFRLTPCEQEGRTEGLVDRPPEDDRSGPRALSASERL